MKRYEVIALSVGGLKNKVFKLGDKVNENNFIGGRADQLVKQGFLKLVGQDDEPIKHEHAEGGVEITKTEEKVEEVKDLDLVPEGDKDDQASIDDITKSEIMAELEVRGVPFDKKSSKTELYELWRSTKK